MSIFNDPGLSHCCGFFSISGSGGGPSPGGSETPPFFLSTGAFVQGSKPPDRLEDSPFLPWAFSPSREESLFFTKTLVGLVPNFDLLVDIPTLLTQDQGAVNVVRWILEYCVVTDLDNVVLATRTTLTYDLDVSGRSNGDFILASAALSLPYNDADNPLVNGTYLFGRFYRGAPGDSAIGDVGMAGLRFRHL